MFTLSNSPETSDPSAQPFGAIRDLALKIFKDASLQTVPEPEITSRGDEKESEEQREASSENAASESSLETFTSSSEDRNWGVWEDPDADPNRSGRTGHNQFVDLIGQAPPQLPSTAPAANQETTQDPTSQSEPQPEQDPSPPSSPPGAISEELEEDSPAKEIPGAAEVPVQGPAEDPDLTRVNFALGDDQGDDIELAMQASAEQAFYLEIEVDQKDLHTSQPKRKEPRSVCNY